MRFFPLLPLFHSFCPTPLTPLPFPPSSIGPTRASKYAHAGCRTLEDLDKRKESEKLKLAKAQKIGLKHREARLPLLPTIFVDD